MSHTLRTAALVVGAVALIATGVGAVAGAAAAGAGIGASAGAAAAADTAATIAAAAGTVASYATVAAIGLSVGAAATAKAPSATATGSPDKFSADPEGAIPYLMGRAGNAGSIVFRRAFDTTDKGDNDRESFVAVLSGGGPISAIESFSVDASGVSFASDGNAIGSPYHDYMWQKTQLGAVNTATALGFGTTAGSPPGWESNRRLHGLAAASWTLRFDTKGKLYQNGVPKPMWVAHGVLCYDPRKDSTYPGGSGSHRWADPSNTAAFDAARATWEYSQNPYLHALRWALGTWERDMDVSGSTYVKTFGMGLPWAGIDVDSFVQAASVADTNGFLVGGVAYSADNKWDTLKKILQAGMGEPLMLGARLSCFVNTPKVSLATITEADFWGDCTVQATQPRTTRINRIVPRYFQEAQQWQLLPGTPVAVSSYYSIDAGQRTKSVDYPLINAPSLIPIACRYDIENAREFGPITMALKLRFIGYKPGDAVTVTNAEAGLGSQLVLITNREFEPSSGTVTLIGRSETTAKHAFALGQTSTAPATPGVSVASLIPAPGSGSWAIVGVSIATGATPVAGFTVAGAVDSPVAEAIVFEYRVHSSSNGPDDNWIVSTIAPPSTISAQVSSVQPGVSYDIAVSYQRNGFTGARLILGPSTAGSGATRNVPRGPWASGTAYDVGDVVSLSGSSYVCILAHTSSGGNTPPNATYWLLLAGKGDPGVGSPGSPGYSNVVVRIFKRAASTPALPSAACTYDFTTGTLSGLNNGWSTSVPAADGNPLYESAAPAVATTSTDSIAASEWASPILSTGAGINTSEITIYKRSATAPSLPSATCTYAFLTGVLTGLNNGWTTAPPTYDGNPLYFSTAVALSTDVTDTIAASEWATAQIMAKDGAPGTGGGGGAVAVTPITGTISTGSTTPSIVTANQPYSMPPGNTPIILDGLITSSGTGTADINVYADYSTDPAFGSFSSLGPFFVTMSGTDSESPTIETNYNNSTGVKQVLYWRSRTTKSSSALTITIKMTLQIGGSA